MNSAESSTRRNVYQVCTTDGARFQESIYGAASGLAHVMGLRKLEGARQIWEKKIKYDKSLVAMICRKI